MIGFVRGKIAYLTTDYCLMDVQGVGYRIFVPVAALGKLRLGQEAMLYTSLQVKEDALQLYGFLSREDQDLFNLLMTVSGIGPKVALGILSSIQSNAFCLAVQQKNITALVKLPGIGKKTAERMILELKDKLGNLVPADCDSSIEDTDSVEQAWQEALQALCSLGYSRGECLEVLKRKNRPEAGPAVEELIKWALRELTKRP